MKTQLFNSIHIDLSEGIFELNGEKIERTKELSLVCEGGNWYLRRLEEVCYAGTVGQNVKE